MFDRPHGLLPAPTAMRFFIQWCMWGEVWIFPFGPSPHGCFPPPLDSLWTAFYWHFGIGVNAVWVFIPLLLGARAVADTATGTSILLSQQAMVEMRRSRERIRNYKTL